MKLLFSTFAMLIATVAFANDSTNIIKTNFVVIVNEPNTDSVEAEDFIIEICDNLIRFDGSDTSRNLIINTTDTIKNQSYYGGYEIVIEMNTNNPEIVANLMYRDGVIVCVGLLREDFQTFWLFNPDVE